MAGKTIDHMKHDGGKDADKLPHGTDTVPDPRLIPCPLCGAPMSQYALKHNLSYRKCKGWGRFRGCGFTKSIPLRALVRTDWRGWLERVEAEEKSKTEAEHIDSKSR